MIPVAPADERTASPSFDAHVRKRGAAAIQRLLGNRVGARGRPPATTYARPEDIPPDKFPTYWTDVRKTDNNSALDDMMAAYGQLCAYLGMRLERATGSPTIDHYIPKQPGWRLVYEWSNYRLCAGCVNGAKGTADVVDPFVVQPGWFELDLGTFLVRRGPAYPAAHVPRLAETLRILNLRACVAQRGQYITDYRSGVIDLPYVERNAPFIALELRRQGQLVRGDV